MENAQNSNNWVSIPVPKELLADVYALISSKKSASSQVPVGELSGSDFWTRPRLERAYKESPGSMKAVFERLASSPDVQLTGEDFLEVVSKARGKKTDRRGLAGVFGAFGRRVKNRYRAKSWPFEAPWDHEHGQVTYEMSNEVAAIINEIK